MTEVSKTVNGLLERHVGGSLPMPLEVMALSHLEMKSDNRGYVQDLEVLAGESLVESAPVDLPGATAILERILDSDDNIVIGRRDSSSQDNAAPDAWMPNALRDFIGKDNVPWRTKMPGFKEYHVGDVDGCEVCLLWIKAGRAMPTHTHDGSELTLVLDGSFADETGRYARGDIAIADESVDHRPVAGDEGPCICFAVTTDSLRLTGSLKDRVRDILGR